MQHTLKTLGFTALLGVALLTASGPAQANNTAVEGRIQSLGDLSMFYQALINTGLINELRADQHYTIFAPTNAALVQITPESYPCFYMVQCRPQIAALLRNHIVPGGYGLNDLTTYGSGIQTIGAQPAHVDEEFVGDYTVDGIRILSKSEVDGNVIYRIDGVIAGRKDLAQFQTVDYVLPSNSVTTQRTVTTYSAPANDPEDLTRTTTIIQRTIVDP